VPNRRRDGVAIRHVKRQQLPFEIFQPTIVLLIAIWTPIARTACAAIRRNAPAKTWTVSNRASQARSNVATDLLAGMNRRSSVGTPSPPETQTFRSRQIGRRMQRVLVLKIRPLQH
jgi:hypothetical protein